MVKINVLCVGRIFEQVFPGTDVLPLYYGLPVAEQKKARPAGATHPLHNLSLGDGADLQGLHPRAWVEGHLLGEHRVDNVSYVGDRRTRLRDVRCHHAFLKGAGLHGSGQCFRIGTKEAYSLHTILSPVPAMVHSRMDAVVLKLHEMRYDDVLRFPFVDPPSVEVLFRAKEDLKDM